MFGAGINDDNTLPYLVGKAAGKNLRPYNFAYSGYGPHQMLAAIEQGIVSNIIDCQPRYAIYWGIVDHARRISGKAAWVKADPRYTLDKEGQVTYAGQFDDPADNNLLRFAGKALRMPLFADRLMSDIRSSDIELMVAVIDQLEARNIQVHRVSTILPDYATRQADYLIEHDGHPNQFTHRLLADYVSRQIIRLDN